MKKSPRHPTSAGLIVAGAVFALGVLFYATQSRLGTKLERGSYDSVFDLTSRALPDISNSEVVIVYMDEASHHDLGQPMDGRWDRALHARLLDRLTEARARAVVFDVVFSDPGSNPEADRRLMDSIRRNGNVILAADYTPDPPTHHGDVSVVLKTLTMPYQAFLDAAAGWGIAQLRPDDDFLARKHFHSDQRDSHPSLPWVAFQHAYGGPTAMDPLQERWVRYYGKPVTIPSVSYHSALNGLPSAGYFRDKLVIIGARPRTGFYIERRDELRSPFSGEKSDFAFMPNVEVHATELLNLIRGDWLVRLPAGWELALMAVASVVFGLGLIRLRPIYLLAVVPAALALIVGMVVLVFHGANLWFNWQAVLLVPLFLAAIGIILHRTVEWYLLRRQFQARDEAAQRRIAEQAALLDKAHDAIIVHDFDWKIRFWNAGAESTYGWTSDEVTGRDIRELLYESFPESGEKARAQLLIDGEWNGELKHLHRTGRTLTMESRWSLVRDEGSRPKSVLLINTDVTERRELEAQFLRTQRMESIGTLAGGIAHDLNNVLAPIMMGIELVRMRVKDEKVEGTLARMAGSAQRGAGLVKQVLTFARGHEGERMAVQLSHLIHEMKKIVMETFPRNIEIKIREEADLRPVFADATQLHQVLLNLCVNARDAMPDGGSITIHASNRPVEADSEDARAGLKPGNYVRLSVADTGTGIPEAIRERIFEPFFTTKEIGKGTGLGLSTVNTIIRNHEGRLEVESETGRGTTFHILLPVAIGDLSVPEAPPSAEELRGHGELILVVDDETAIRELAAAALQEFGYRVRTAQHGQEAIAVCESLPEPISLLVTDIMMPVMDGTRTIKALRTRHPGLPVLAMSGLLESSEVKRQQSLERTEVLAKPFDPIQLTQAVHRLLNEQKAARLAA